jgi:hypothetical protein
MKKKTAKIKYKFTPLSSEAEAAMTTDIRSKGGKNKEDDLLPCSLVGTYCT